MERPTFGERDLCEVKVEGMHLRLFCELGPQGFIAIVWDVRNDKAIFNETADSFEDGKTKCERFTTDLTTLAVPEFDWKHYPAISARAHRAGAPTHA